MEVVICVPFKWFILLRTDIYLGKVGFGGAFWLELIGGMLWAVHRVLLRMVLVRRCKLFSHVEVSARGIREKG